MQVRRLPDKAVESAPAPIFHFVLCGKQSKNLCMNIQYCILRKKNEGFIFAYSGMPTAAGMLWIAWCHRMNIFLTCSVKVRGAYGLMDWI